MTVVMRDWRLFMWLGFKRFFKRLGVTYDVVTGLYTVVGKVFTTTVVFSIGTSVV
jgi:hypothetical protein